MNLKEQASCPRCGIAGKDVGAITVRSLVPATEQVGPGPHRFCATPSCDVVYYQEGGSTIPKDRLAVRVGLKESESPRPVCYCFGHTVESINEEIRRTGESTAAADITAKIKAGLCACEVKNPEGVCCLGRVSRVVKEGMARAGDAGTTATGASCGLTDGGAADCCAPMPVESPPATLSRRATAGGGWTLGAASVSAILASACCWLPLALVGLGASTAGVSAVFERLRPILLVMTVALLGAGFYYALAPAKACEPGSACAVPDPRARRRNRTLLWIATAFVAAMALFPLYAGWFGGRSVRAADAADTANAVVARMTVSGMHCACAAGVTKALLKVPGVLQADVDYQAKTATVRIRRGASVGEVDLQAAVAAAGYQASGITLGRSRTDEEDDGRYASRAHRGAMGVR